MSLAVAHKDHPLEGDFLLAAVIEFFESAFASNGQIGVIFVESVEETGSFSLKSTNLHLAVIKGYGEWVGCSEELLENFIGVSLKFISGFETVFSVRDTRLHQLLSVFVVDVFKLRSA